MALTRQVARRYAQALFEIVQDGEGKGLADDLAVMADLVKLPEISNLLCQPKVKPEEKAKVLIKAGKIKTKEAKNLVELLCRRGKAILLPEIYELFNVMLKKAAAEVEVEVVSAVPLSGKVKEELKQVLAKGLGKKVVLKMRQDENVLGGLLLTVGDRRIDATLRGKLEGLRRLLAA